MKIRSARTDEIKEIRELLVECGLPAEDVTETAPISFLVAEKEPSSILGCVGFECYGEFGLLRSLAVTKDARGGGIGHALVEAVENAARLHAVAELFLLTTTASRLFCDIGYNVVERSGAPETLRGSTQFASLCPASATCMHKVIRAA